MYEYEYKLICVSLCELLLDIERKRSRGAEGVLTESRRTVEAAFRSRDEFRWGDSRCKSGPRCGGQCVDSRRRRRVRVGALTHSSLRRAVDEAQERGSKTGSASLAVGDSKPRRLPSSWR